MGLRVGDKRVFSNYKNYPFEILCVGEEKYFCRYIVCPPHNPKEFSEIVEHIHIATIPWEEPKPVRRLTAWEYRNTGEVVFSLSDGINHSGYYRKLSDQELKELIKGVIGE